MHLFSFFNSRHDHFKRFFVIYFLFWVDVWIYEEIHVCLVQDDFFLERFDLEIFEGGFTFAWEIFGF